MAGILPGAGFRRITLVREMGPMRAARVQMVFCAIAMAGANACGFRDSGPADTTALGPQLRVAIVASANDPRIAPAREAIAYWNHEFLRLGRRIHFDSTIVVNDSIPEELLRAASGEATLGFGSAITRLREALPRVPADVVIALSHTDLISFSLRS